MTTSLILCIVAIFICLGSGLWTAFTRNAWPFIFGWPIAFILTMAATWFRHKESSRENQKGFTLIELIIVIFIIVIILIAIFGFIVLIHFIKKHW